MPVFLVALWLHLTAASAPAQPWSQRLGYPAGQRVIILDIREMGVSWEMNQAGMELLENGHATSADLVVTAPWFDDFAAWARHHPEHDLGLSIALTNPYEALSWRLLSSEQAPTTLVDADGYPWKNVMQLAVSADPEDMKREVDAQIARARAKGVPISHLSGYHGTCFCRADLASVLLAASQKYWLPVPVVDLTPELIDRFQRQGYPVDATMVDLITNYPLPKLDDLQLAPYGETYEQTLEKMCALVKSLKPGLTEIVCQPSVESDGLKRLTPEWQNRVWMRQVLSDPVFLQTLKDEQIALTNWREIMRRFEGAGPTPRPEAVEESVELLDSDLPVIDDPNVSAGNGAG
jgi:hypothetical protein